jgi:hypothetical protein
MPRRILASPAAAVLALALTAPAAPAKELTQALACGSSGCRDVTARVGHGEAALQSGGVDPGPSQRARFYRIRFRVGDGSGRTLESWRVIYVPSRRLVGSVDRSVGRRVWTRMTPETVRIFRRVVRGVQPFPARRLRLPRGTEEASTGAPQPAVPPPPATVERSSSGLDAWPALALVVPVGGLAVLAGCRRARRHRDDAGSPPPAAGT